MAETVQISFPLGYANLVAACAKNHGALAARRFVESDAVKLVEAFTRYARENAAPTTGTKEIG